MEKSWITEIFGTGGTDLSYIDIAVIVLYLVAIVGLGCWVGIRQRRDTEGGRSYFLAGGTLTWPVIGLALFSTNISTIHLVGFAQEGYENGLAHGNFEWMAPFTLIALALFFAPFYIRSRVTTLPDFLEMRYSRGCRDWLAVLSIVSAIAIHIGFTLYTGGVVLKGLFGIPIMTSIVLAAILTGLYTIVGGLLAVVLTESLQTIVLLTGSIIITVVAFSQVGGWEGITNNVDPVKLTVLRSAEDPANLPWYSVFLGYPVIGLWYWCADQTIVQRVLGAKDENHARVGPLFAGFIKILPVFIFVLPGTMCLAMVHQGKLAPLEDSKNTYDFMIRNLLPTGLTGVMAAALLAALMSTVSGALNSIATLFSFDLYRRWKPEAPDRQLVRVGRIVTFFAMILAILWSPFVGRYPTLYQGVNTVICYLAPPVTVVFVFGVFWRRASAIGALTTLVSGSVMGGVVFLVDIFKDQTGWNVPFMMSAFYLFLACSTVMISVSLIYPHKHTAASEKLVWRSPLDAMRGEAWRGIGNYKFLAVLLFVTMVALYTIFGYGTVKPDPKQIELKGELAALQGRFEQVFSNASGEHVLIAVLDREFKFDDREGSFTRLLILHPEKRDLTKYSFRALTQEANGEPLQSVCGMFFWINKQGKILFNNFGQPPGTRLVSEWFLPSGETDVSLHFDGKPCLGFQVPEQGSGDALRRDE